MCVLEEKSCQSYFARAKPGTKQFYFSFCVLGQVVYANHFINLTGENLTSTSLFEKHCGNLIADLVSLAINKYTKVTLSFYIGHGQLDACNGNHVNWVLQCLVLNVMYGFVFPCFKECYLLGAQIVLYLFMTIWQLNERVILKCTVYRAEVSATFPKFSVPGLMPNMAQSKRFR